MTSVQDRASLHESAVQAVARDGVETRRRGRGPTKTRWVLSSRAGRVDPLIWKLVKDCGVDPRHVQILGERQIVIWNHPGPWPEVQ